MASWRIPLTDLDYDQRERAAALGPLDDRWLSMGPEVQAFEREFAELVGVDHAIAPSRAGPRRSISRSWPSASRRATRSCNRP